ncbi:MAG: hypothetical protein F7C34_02110 [Desulfurococcales archaeon]|nr:hypothetical protein [Desulfurococcales archaeon]
MIPSPRPRDIEPRHYDNMQMATAQDEATLIVHIDMYYTSLYALEAVRRAVEELLDVYGISMQYEISNDTLLGSYARPQGVIVIEIGGIIIEVPDYDAGSESASEYVSRVKDIIVREVLRVIGSSYGEGHAGLPYSPPETPSAPEAVIIAAS